jgi:hypothetical protein
LFFVPELLFDELTAPLLVCVTVTVLVLVDEAAPVVTLAFDLPVFVPEFVFAAVPPELPAMSPADDPLEPMSPLFADASAPCELPLLPLTPENAALKPVFETAACLVPTHELWFTLASAVLELSIPPPPATLFSVLLESFDDDTAPLFDWLGVTVDVFVESAAPVVTFASEVPSLLPVFPFDAFPPMFPALSPALSVE